MSWTDERVEKMCKLWNDGLSASQVATELGDGVSRLAVIGKLHRIGAAERGKTPTMAMRDNGSRRRSSLPKPPMPRIVPRKEIFVPIAVAKSVPEIEVVIPESLRVTLMELGVLICRWPLGDPARDDFRFCGAAHVAAEGPYCTYHSRIAYTATDRQKLSQEQVDKMRQGMLKHHARLRGEV